jgi:hypothetical protein
MKISYREKVTDPEYPIMHGKTPIAKEFNKRQEKLWEEGRLIKVDYEQVTTVILELLCDDYDKRHASRKRKNKQIESLGEE